MANLHGFDANQIDPSSDLAPLPAGKYVAIVVESEMKPTRAGTGSYLQLTFEVLEGEHKGRFLWARLNLDNPNATAVTIARAELSALCRAVGVLKPNDSHELHHLPLVIHVTCKKRPDTGEIRNEIHGYAPRSSLPSTGASGETSSPRSVPSTSAAASSGTPTSAPWKRNS